MPKNVIVVNGEKLRFLNEQISFAYSVGSSVDRDNIIHRQNKDPGKLIELFVEDINDLREDIVRA